MKRQYDLLFFIGTDAELIKMFPVIQAAERSGLSYCLIGSGQNDLSNSCIMNEILKRSIDLELSKESSIKKTAVGLFSWFLKTTRHAAKSISRHLDASNNPIMIVHGDTVSTVMGALAARKLHVRVAHVEAGLRSFNWLNPFPEEIDRQIVSKIASIHFAPTQEAANNLIRTSAKGHIVNTINNTLIDSLAFTRTIPCKNAVIQDICTQKHHVMVLHRQENLANTKLVNRVVDLACAQNSDSQCVFILHEPTRVVLEEKGLLEKLRSCNSVTLLPRVEYCDFMKLLDSSEYVITDGGSNQEELYYLGVPCLILRTHTERNEGLGHNANLFNGDIEEIARFASSFEKHRCTPADVESSPSQIIINELVRLRETGN